MKTQQKNNQSPQEVAPLVRDKRQVEVEVTPEGTQTKKMKGEKE